MIPRNVVNFNFNSGSEGLKFIVLLDNFLNVSGHERTNEDTKT